MPGSFEHYLKVNPMSETLLHDHLYLTFFTIVSTLFLWSGTFMFMRSRTSTYLRMTGLAMVIVWFYVSGSMLVETASSTQEANFWVRWSFVIPWSAAFWYHAVASLVGLRKQHPRMYRASLWLSYLWSTFLVVAGSFSDLLIDYSLTTENPEGPPAYFFSVSTLYPLFALYFWIFLALATGLMTIHAIRAYPAVGKLQRVQDIALSVAAGALWLSASIIMLIAVYVERWKATEVYAQPTLLLAFVAITIGSIGYRGVMDTVGMFRKYLDASVAAAMIFLLFTLLFLETNANMPTYISVAFLALFGYGYHDARLSSSTIGLPGAWFGRTLATFRSRYELLPDGSAQLTVAEGTDPHRVGLLLSNYLETERLDQIEYALKNFFDHSKLESSPLLGLELVTGPITLGKSITTSSISTPSVLEKMNTLRFLLREAVHGMRPAVEPEVRSFPSYISFKEDWGPFAAALYYVEGGRTAEKKWESIWEHNGGEMPVQYQVLIWRRLDSQRNYRKWRDRYLTDAVRYITGYVLEAEARYLAR